MNILNKKVTRRTFLKGAAALSAAGILGSTIRFVSASAKDSSQDPDPVEADKLVRSACLMCHGGCGIQAKIKDGILIKIDGNPYDPRTKEPHLKYSTDPSIADKTPGSLCAKGQAGIKELYDPLRVKYPLRRAGLRGSGRWKRISWEQAVNEIVEGGDLFGEGHVDGLRALRNLNDDIDPNDPGLGKKVNQVVYSVGRSEHGRKEFTDRFWGNAYGTINKRIDHTSICETSHHVAYELGTNPSKAHMKPDLVNAQYVIFFGTSPVEANFPMQAIARKTVAFKVNKGKLVIVDPRFSNSAAIADTWIPIKMGTDAAFALGMVRWIIENNKFDHEYLKNTTFEAAKKDGHTTYTNAAYLVRLDDMTLLRGHHSTFDTIDTDKTGPDDKFAVFSNGETTIHDKVEHADLEVTQTVKGTKCKSVFTLLKERVMEKTIEEYASISGLAPGVIREAAEDFTSHGRKACADFYRGSVQHTNGTYTARAIITLNYLIGNVGWKGGMSTGGGHWHEMGGKEGNPYDLQNKLHPGKVKSSGVVLTRYKKTYEDTTEFKNNKYPAKRPWFPFALHGNWQEIIPSIGAAYPYPVKCLINHMGNAVYSVPGGSHFIDVLKDPKKLPLIISFTTVMGETDALSDYILPDRHFLERYGTPHTAPTIQTKVSQLRVPVIDPVYPETRLEEDVLIEIGRKLELPGIGDNGFGIGMPLNEAYDWYKKCFINIASEDGGVHGITEGDRLNYILTKGGRFEDFKKGEKGEHLGHAYKGMCVIYNEDLAKQKDSMTGKNYDGLPKYEPIKDCMGKIINDEGYNFRLNTHKMAFHTQSRTASNEWLMEIMPENFVDINTDDAKKLGIKNKDKVRVSSASNKEGIEGVARVREGLRPGVINISHNYGHWEYGSKSFEVDGKKTDSAPWRGKGISPNPIMRLDPVLGDVTLQDPIGGSASFYDTNVKVERL